MPRPTRERVARSSIGASATALDGNNNDNVGVGEDKIGESANSTATLSEGCLLKAQESSQRTAMRPSDSPEVPQQTLLQQRFDMRRRSGPATRPAYENSGSSHSKTASAGRGGDEDNEEQIEEEEEDYGDEEGEEEEGDEMGVEEWMHDGQEEDMEEDDGLDENEDEDEDEDEHEEEEEDALLDEEDELDGAYQQDDIDEALETFPGSSDEDEDDDGGSGSGEMVKAELLKQRRRGGNRRGRSDDPSALGAEPGDDDDDDDDDDEEEEEEEDGDDDEDDEDEDEDDDEDDDEEEDADGVDTSAAQDGIPDGEDTATTSSSSSSSSFPATSAVPHRRNTQHLLGSVTRALKRRQLKQSLITAQQHAAAMKRLKDILKDVPDPVINEDGSVRLRHACMHAFMLSLMWCIFLLNPSLLFVSSQRI